VSSSIKSNSFISSLFSSIAAEWLYCWNRRDCRWLSLGLACFTALGTRIIFNPYTLGFLSAEEMIWHPTQLWLANLVATYNYLLPLASVILTFDLWSQSAGENSGRGRKIGRLLWLHMMVGFSFVIGFTAVVLNVIFIGEPLSSAVIMRAIGIWGAATLLVNTVFGLIACVASFVRDAERSMKWSMGLLTAIIVGVPLLSDILLYREFGPMPMPGTPAWEQYLETARNSLGMAVYFLSPMETFMSLTTYLSGVKQLTAGLIIGLWSILAFQAFIAWLIFGILYIIRKVVIHRVVRHALA